MSRISHQRLAEVVCIPGVQQLGRDLSALFAVFFLPHSQSSPLATDSTGNQTQWSV